MSAKVAYLLPNGCAYNGPCDNDENANISGLVSEAQDGVNQDPEWRAAQWFYDEYVRPGKGEFVAVANFGTKYSEFSTIWIHLDRENVAEDVLSYYNSDNQFITHLKAFTAQGGNLLLSKHASQLLGDGRLSRLVRSETVGSSTEQRFSPQYPRASYIYDDKEVKWYIATNFNGRDNSTHPVFNNMDGGTSDNCKNVETLYVGAGKHHTDFNCGIPRDWIHVVINPDDNYETQKAKVDKFEEVCQCRIIGTWGGHEQMQYGGFVEFFPKGDDFKGTILMYGIAAYCWGANNGGWGYNNVQKMTRNGINYLENTPNGKNTTDKKLVDIFAEDWCYPASLATENHEFRIVHPNIDGWTMSSWIADDQKSIADIRHEDRGEGNKHDRLYFKQEGTVQLHLKVTEDREFQAWPKGEYEFVRDIKFTYKNNPTPQVVADEDLASNGRDGESGKFMVLHANMRGLVIPAEKYVVSFDGIDEANRAEVTKITDGDFTRLAFTKAGSVKLNIEANEPNYREDWAPGTHNLTKTVTFAFDKAEPVHGWPSELTDHVGINHEVTLYDKTEGLDVTYTFEQGDGVSTYDSETHKIKFLKAGTVKIKASVTENNYVTTWAKGTYNYEKTVTVDAPQVTWAKDDSNNDMIPEDAAILEENYKRTPKAVCNVEGLAVKYKSADATKIAINETTGALQYKVPTEGDGIAITAYVELNGVEYGISHTTKCLAPIPDWTTEPSAEGVVGQEMTVAGKTRYGNATFGIEAVSGCTYSDGKLLLTAVGEAKVKPYCQAYDKTYPGEVKTITVSAPTFTWVTNPSDAAVTEDKPAVVITVNNGCTVQYKSSDENVATVAADGKLTYLHAGETTITGYVVVDGVTYESEGKVAHVSGMTVNWTTEPAATATVGDEMAIAAAPIYGSATAKFKTNENCSYDENTGKLTFLHAGTATVQPYTEGYGEDKFWGVEKTITVAPKLVWTTEPQSACVGETGKVAIASTSDGTIVYSSSDADKVSVDHSGNLTFKPYKTAGKVTIYATVTIGENPYHISGEVDANLPWVYWVAEKTPGATYRLDETPSAEAKLQYGPATVQYECTNCTWANDQLTFTAVGEATITPYVQYGEEKYYGEKKTINVTPATTTYSRTVTPGKYGTICLERTSTALEGATFYWPAYKNKAEGVVDYIVLEEVETLTAGQGYFFYATASEVKVTMSLSEEALTTPIDNGTATHGMHGNFTGTLNVPDYNAEQGPNEYILNSNSQLVYGTGNWIGEHRAYLKMSEVPAQANEAPGRHYIRMVVNQPNTPTDMEAVVLQGEATKIMLNGQIYILRGEQIYTIDGRLVK